jgi:hypothetical protein
MAGAAAHRPWRFSCRFEQVLVLGKAGDGRGVDCEVHNLTGEPIYGGLTGYLLRSSSPAARADGISSTKAHRGYGDYIGK